MKIKIDNLEIDVGKYYNLDLYIRSLETVKRLVHNKDYDYLFVIDAKKKTGVGKSTLALFMALYLDPDFDLDKQLTFADISMMKRTFKRLSPGSVVVVDEAGAGMNALDFAKKEVKEFSKTIEICRARKLVLILVLPTVFYLTKSVRLGINAMAGIKRRGLGGFYLQNELIKAWAPYIETYETQSRVKPYRPKPLYDFSWPSIDGSRIYQEYYQKKMEFIDDWLSRPADGSSLPPIFGTKELAKYLGVSQSTVLRYVKQGIIPPETYRVINEKIVFYRGPIRKLFG